MDMVTVATGAPTLSRTSSRKRAAIASTGKRVTVITVFIVCIIGMVHVNYRAEQSWEYFIGAFGSISFVYFLFKMMCSFLYKPDVREPLPGIRVTVVVPSYNEKPEAVTQTLECLLEQNYPVHEIFFIDDGSKDTSGYEAIVKLADEINGWKEVAVTFDPKLSADWSKGFMEYPEIIVHRFEKNRGKRNAQVYGFEHATGDVIMIVDSDGYIYPDAVRELLKPFHDDEVMAVTGHVNARNREDNFVTRLQDVLYDSAFRVGRGAMSISGSVIVCSGAISLFKREVVLDHMDDFKEQTLFGKSVQVGDDRRLTTIALSEGKVKYQSTARCITDVPTRLRQFFIQQVRWSKSFYVESAKALSVAWNGNRPLLLLWLLGEGLIWAIFGSTVIASWVYHSATMQWLLMVYALGYLTMTTLANNVYYLLKRPVTYLFSPIFGLVHMMLIFPIRLYALLTLSSSGWGTR